MNRSSKLSLLLIFVTVFIDLLGFGIVLPLLPRYARHFDANDLTLGLLMASFSAMQFLFAPIWGRISDRVGRRPVLIIGLAGSTLFYGLFGYATSLGAEGQLLGISILPWLFFTRIGAGIAGATIPTAQAYIADVTGPQERARGMALIGAAFGIGFTFGPLLGAGFVTAEIDNPVELVSPESVAQYSLTTGQQETLKNILAEKGSVPTYAANTEVDRNSRRARDQELVDVLTAEQRSVWKKTTAPSAAPGYIAGALSGLALLSSILLLPESLRPDSSGAHGHWLDLGALRVAVARPSIGLILLTMFLTTLAFAQFETTLSVLTAHLGLADKDNYYVFAYIGLVLSLSQGFLVRRLVPKLGEFRMSVIGTILMTIGLLLIGVAAQRGSSGFLYAVLPVVVIGFSALNPSLQSLLSRRSAASDQGGILGTGQSMSALARILGPVIGLTLNGKNIVYPYWSAAAIMAFGIVLTLGLRSAPPDDVAVNADLA